MDSKYQAIQLENQLCFPFYAVSNKLIRRYRRLLKYLNLTYTQYLVMVCLWKKENINQKTLSETLLLKSNTLGPVLAKLRQKGLINVSKNKDDERNITIALTNKGRELKEKAVNVPPTIIQRVNLTEEETKSLKTILDKLLNEVDSDIDD